MMLCEALERVERINVKIGAKNGSSFFYVGRKDVLMEKMDDISDGLKLSHIARGSKEVEFVPLPKREVIDFFDSDPLVDETTIIIVEGHEQGKFWWLGEKPEIEDGKDILTKLEKINRTQRKKKKEKNEIKENAHETPRIVVPGWVENIRRRKR